MVQEIHQEIEHKMEMSLAALQKDLSRIRTGRASLALVDSIVIDYYGTPTPLNQLATLAVPDSRLLTIQPWDKSQMGTIEKAILRSDLGLTPVNDGQVIRLAIPPLTEERRKELVKQVKKIGEEAKIAIRNVRREGNEGIKTLEKAKEISEDDCHRAQDEVQKATNRFVAKVDEILNVKEREVMEV